ncbi:hypothetical protein [Agrococcus sp. ProA11]|uniref:hypothetical protein n=1 Tax=Agrococcus chionoecetis TaxID=3153752 RepID=UPI0032614863
MRPRSGKVTVAAALLSVTALTGCGAGSTPPEAATTTPPAPAASPPTGSHPGVIDAPAPASERPPLSPPREQPLPEVPTVRGPYVPPPPTTEPAPSGPPRPSQPAPTVTATPTPSATPSATPTSAPTPAPTPAGLVALLPRAADLPPLTWTAADGTRSADWTETSPPAAVPVASALTHVSAARAAGGDCASASRRVDGSVLAAAAVSLAAEPAPGAPMDVVLLRYASAQLASDAITALRALGTACAGVETADGTLGAGAGGRVTLTSGDAVLIVEGRARGTLLIAVQHEGAPPEAVAALLAAVR